MKHDSVEEKLISEIKSCCITQLPDKNRIYVTVQLYDVFLRFGKKKYLYLSLYMGYVIVIDLVLLTHPLHEENARLLL